METCDLYILKIFAFKMLTVARKTFSLIFVSKKQKLKISQGGEAPAEATSAFEMVPSSEFVYTIRLQSPSSLRRLWRNNMATAKNVSLSPHKRRKRFILRAAVTSL